MGLIGYNIISAKGEGKGQGMYYSMIPCEPTPAILNIIVYLWQLQIPSSLL